LSDPLRAVPRPECLEEEIDMLSEVQEALEKIRPMLRADGGDVELVEITADGVVRVRLEGACHGCAMSRMTLKNGIERVLKEEVPGVTEVEAV
jgi:Fe-S cluster biogenesis protein NfuA